MLSRPFQLFDDFPEKKLTREFWRFHDANPHIFSELLRLALDLKVNGSDRYSVKALIEVLRWQKEYETAGGAYKINNNYGPYYARLLMREDKRLDGFFHIRTAIADEI